MTKERLKAKQLALRETQRMGKASHREEVIKHLTEQIKKTKDPQALAELTKQLTKLLPKQRVEKAKQPQGPKSTFVKADYKHGDWLEKLPMGKREFWRLIHGFEAIPGHAKMTPDERNALLVKMEEGFSDAER